ncbi:MAG: ABC transporter ATP-binding protein, partial [Clostridia bacterium]|nr:ABC transporter ATP-binding protein [Clostridia bacterium]
KLLIADEATSALDVSVQAKIMKLFMELQESRGLTLLFITHNIALARKISDRIIVLKNGEIVEYGHSAAIIRAPVHPYTKSLIDAAPQIF